MRYSNLFVFPWPWPFIPIAQFLYPYDEQSKHPMQSGGREIVYFISFSYKSTSVGKPSQVSSSNFTVSYTKRFKPSEGAVFIILLRQLIDKVLADEGHK